MLTIIIYGCKVMLISALLYGYYRLFLRNRAFHRYNRFYLLSIPALSFLLPFIPLPAFINGSWWMTTASHPASNNLYAFATGQWHEQDNILSPSASAPSFFSWPLLLTIIYGMSSLVLCLRLLRQWMYIRSLQKTTAAEVIQGIRLFYTQAPGTPFSFLNNIFWNEKLDRFSPRGKEILQHELCHVQQRHTIDVLYMQCVLIVGWINPLFHFIYKELSAIHEFQADASALSNDPSEQAAYAELLVWQSISSPSLSLWHPFFQSPIKRRIHMILQSKQKRHNPFSRWMAIPLLILVCCAFATRTHHTATPATTSSQPLTVIIDPGHGGIDPGAKSADGVNEKDLVLSIAKKVQEQAAHYPFTIILTRTTDQLPGNTFDIRQGLKQRVEIAAKNKADLFISLHVNNAEGNTPEGGIEAYIAAQQPYKGSAGLANALLNQLSSTYAVSPLIRQRTEGHIIVLDHSPCPAVLLELGYINLPKDFQFISAADNQEKIAHDILEGIAQYQQKAGN